MLRDICFDVASTPPLRGGEYLVRYACKKRRTPMNRWLRLTLAVLVLALLAGHLPVQAETKTTITGVVKNASGTPVEGAFVRVRNVEKGLTFMVVSQAQGRYTTPNLLPGKYTVEAIGGNLQQGNATGPVEAGSGQQAKWDVELSVARKPISERKRLTQADFAAV